MFYCFLIALILVWSPSTLLAQTFFPFSDHPIDVVIPCAEKDLPTLDLCIDGIKANGTHIRRVIVVSKNKLTNQAEWFSEENYPFSLSDVALALANGNRNAEEVLLRKYSRLGWYYQQLLKLYAPFVIPDISPNVLVLDADTIFLNPVTFLNEQNGGLYNPGVEYNLPYFGHGALLIPGFYKCFPEYSGISHHMIFQRAVIEDLFHTVEQYHNESFWTVFCRLVDPQSLFGSGASEYEIYFNYIFARTQQTSVRQLKWKDIQKLSEIPQLKKEGFDYISIHCYGKIE